MTAVTIDEAEYHRHPALSASGAKLLVPPSTPAHYLEYVTNGQPSRAVFDFGRAAHAQVLGAGAPIAVIPEDLLASNGAATTKAAKEFIAQARINGETPLSAKDHTTITAMAAAIRSHPIAAALLNPERGKPEQSLFWTDEPTGVPMRARLDWLPSSGTGRMILADYKTAQTANPWKWMKQSADYGVHMQHANYVRAVKACGLADDVAMVFILQEKTAPYLVSVVEIDAESVAVGATLMDYAARTFATCTATNQWPGYGNEVTNVSLPRYYITQLEKELPDVF